MGKVVVTAPGRGGVNIDSDILLQADDELLEGQNAYHDFTAGHAGALRKRPGLVKFNTTASGGSILGGITMAIAGLGGAPAPTFSGGGGSADGAGDGLGAPGGTFDGETVDFGAQGAALFGGGSLFSGARLIVLGRHNSTSGDTGGIGWFVTSLGIANTANLVTSPGPPGKVYSYPPTVIFDGAFGRPACLAGNGYLYYAAAHNQVTGTQSTIRATNGATDSLIATIPTDAAGGINLPGDTTERQAIVWMHLGYDSHIYIAAKSRAAGQTTNTNYGHIFRLNTSTNVLTAIDNNGATGFAYLPYCVALHNSGIFWGTFNLDTNELDVDTNSIIYATSPDGTTTSNDHAFSDGEAITTMQPYPYNTSNHRRLFIGGAVNKTVATRAQLYSRDRSVIGTSTAYTAHTPGTINTDAGTAVNGNMWVSLLNIENGSYAGLYASYYNPSDKSLIYKYTPNFASVAADGGWDGSGTWSLLKTMTSPVPLHLFGDGDYIYAVGSIGAGTRGAFYSSDGGANWTTVTTNLPTTTTSYPIPVFFAVDQ